MGDYIAYYAIHTIAYLSHILHKPIVIIITVFRYLSAKLVEAVITTAIALYIADLFDLNLI